jgi:hypothetical protein
MLRQRRREARTGETTRLTGSAALQALMRHTYRSRFLEIVCDPRQHFERNLRLLKAVNLYQVRRRWGFEMFPDEAAKLERETPSRQPAVS